MHVRRLASQLMFSAITVAIGCSGSDATTNPTTAGSAGQGASGGGSGTGGVAGSGGSSGSVSGAGGVGGAGGVAGGVSGAGGGGGIAGSAGSAGDASVASGGSGGVAGSNGGAGGGAGVVTGGFGGTMPTDAQVTDPGPSSGTVSPPAPAAFPSPCIAAGAQKVEDILNQMTDQEMMSMLGGTDGKTAAVSRLGVPSIVMSDGPHGIRGGSQWPCLVSAACSFDPVLEEEVGAAMAKEFRAQGKLMDLGPMVNVIRDGRWGRASETYSEDPYLMGKMGASRIRGIQSVGLIADAKHFDANNIETGRGGYPVKVSERTLREVYLPAFRMAVQEGGAWSLMAAYNQVNGSACAANMHLLHDILKGEWQFPGFVVSDWGAAYGNTVGDALAGLDSEMPGAGAFSVNALQNAISSGKITREIVKDKTRRLLRAIYCAGALDPGWTATAYSGINNTDEQKAIVSKAGHANIVLAKNDGNVLPIDRTKIQSIAILGPKAATGPRFGAIGSGMTTGPTIGPLEAITKKLGASVKVITDDTWQSADTVVVFVGINDSGEGFDRKNLDLPKYNAAGDLEKNNFGATDPDPNGPYDQDQNALVAQALAAKPDKTVVVYTGGSFSVAGTWATAPGVLIALYPGGDQGNAIADVLFGDTNPGGHLSITFPMKAEDVPLWGTDDVALYSQYEPPDEARGWPYYDKKNLPVLFPFGHGLSYTTFRYSNLQIAPQTMAQNGNITVSVDVHNTGARAGDEVVQLYVADPEASVPRRVKDLRGFLRVALAPDEKKTVAFTLKPEDLAFYDEQASTWVAEPGLFDVMVGSSSRDLRLAGSFTLSP
jgi:beta-glucosidase